VKFVKGKSGNPSGRPKENAEVKELARQFTNEAIERLAYWMRSDNAKASVAASTTLIERGHGKAQQSIDMTVTQTPEARVYPSTPKEEINESVH